VLSRSILIKNDWQDGSDTLTVYDPFQGSIAASYSIGGVVELDAAVKAAQDAFESTRDEPPYRRSDLLARVAAGIEQNRARLVESIISEAGKPVTLAQAEVDRTVTTFRCAAEEARNTGAFAPDADAFAQGAGHHARVIRRPIGVIYAITPFNFPLNLVAHKVAPCIASGNTMVLKPSPKAPGPAVLLARILVDAGLPPGQVNLVPCSNSHAGVLVGDERVAMFTFTGSAAVGWDLRRKSGRQKTVLELGGTATAVVCDDADLEMAVPSLARGAFAYAGQSCISVQRILVQKGIMDRFRDRLLREIEHKVRTGDPRREDVLVGPLIDAAATARVRHTIEQAQDAGAVTSCGGGLVEGVCLAPTVLERVRHDLDAWAEEIFGPVVVLQEIAGMEDATRLINDSPYGLQSGIFTNRIDHALDAAKSWNVGAVLVNQSPTFRLDHLPYGGVGLSGEGREGIRSSMTEMTTEKLILFRGRGA
jgi:glyceraldehyde-3-phosphate dehydrogenase (NADP+)